MTLASPIVQPDGSFAVVLPKNLANNTYHIELKSMYNGKSSPTVAFFQEVKVSEKTPETPGDFPFLPKENVAVGTVVESDLVPIT